MSHDDHDLGSVYELEGELLDRLLAAGVVVDAAEWRYQYRAPQDSHGDQEHRFRRVAPAPVTEVAPDPASSPAPASVTEVAPTPIAPGAPAPETR